MSISPSAVPEPESSTVREIRKGADISAGKWPLHRTILLVISMSIVLWGTILLAGWLVA